MSGTISATTASLIAALVGAAGVTSGIVGQVDSSKQNAADQAANRAQLTQEQQAQANQANLTKQEAVLGATGQAQAQTGGSLTDSGTASLTDLLAGYPGYQAGNGTSTGTGVAPSTIAGGTTAPAPNAPGTPDITSILATLRGGSAPGSGSPSSISGGNWQTQPAQPQTQFELANPLV